MDTNVLGNDVHNVNVLTVIASESYDSFAKGLQNGNLQKQLLTDQRQLLQNYLLVKLSRMTRVTNRLLTVIQVERFTLNLLSMDILIRRVFLLTSTMRIRLMVN